MMKESWRVKGLVFHFHLLLTFWMSVWVILAAALHFLTYIPVLWGHILTSLNWVQTTQSVHGFSFLGWMWISSLFPICHSSLCPCKAKARFLACSLLVAQVEQKAVLFFFPTGYFSEMAHFPKAQSCSNHLIMSIPLLSGRISVSFHLCIFFPAWLTYRLE